MNDWRPATCLVVLRKQLDREFPDRPTDSDGMVASAAHHSQNPTSDHEPHKVPGGGTPVVLAFDITTAGFTDRLAEQFRQLGKAGDRRPKYGIYKRRIFSARDNWAWRPYTPESQGHYVDPHDNHLHLSVINDPDVYDSTLPWPVLGLAHERTTAAPPTYQEPDMVIIYATGKPTALFADGKLKPLDSNREKDALTAAGVPVKHLTADQFTLVERVAAR